MSNNPRSLTRRPSRSLPAAVLAIVLLALGALGAWLTVTLLATGQWPAQATRTIESIGSTPMGSTAVLATACALAVLGLAMLLLALWPGSPRHVAILGDAIPGQTVISHRDLSTLIQRRVEQVDGVQSARVRTTRSRTAVHVDTLLTDNAQLRQDAHAAALSALEQINPDRPMRIRVRMRRTD